MLCYKQQPFRRYSGRKNTFKMATQEDQVHRIKIRNIDDLG